MPLRFARSAVNSVLAPRRSLAHPALSGGSFGGRAPCSTAPATGAYSSSTPFARLSQQQAAAAHVAAADEVDRKPQPSPKIASSTSTYFGDATLPSSTTSHSDPISRSQRPRAPLERTPIARVVRIDVAARERAQRSAGHARVGPRRPAFGVMTWMPSPTTGLPGSGTAAKRRA